MFLFKWLRWYSKAFLKQVYIRMDLECYIMFQDVFILDTCDDVFVWIGEGSSREERKNAMVYAHVSWSMNDVIKLVVCVR